jgi:hypothetical protein
MVIDDFGLFWNAYPRKVSVVSARESWKVAITKVNPKVILDAVQAYAADPNRDPTFTPSPARWLDEERWSDDPLPPRKLSPDELRKAELEKARLRDEAERKKALELDLEAQRAREQAVPIPDEVKKRLLEQWSRNVYPRP